MKLEIIKEQEYAKEPWYILKVNDKTFDVSRQLEKIEQLYEKVKEDPSIINTSIIILKSEEIDVNL